MKVKISLILCLFLISLGAHAQHVQGSQNLGYGMSYDKFCFGPAGRLIPLNLKKPAKDGVADTNVHTVWNSGRVSFADGSEFEGFLHYDIGRNLVKVQSLGGIQVYRANELVSFELYKNGLPLSHDLDSTTEKLAFSSFAYPRSTSERYKLFQVVFEGNMNLLRRVGNSFRRPEGKLYLMNSEGKIMPIRKKSEAVIESFDRNQKELKELIEREQLNLLEMGDLMRLVEAYNQLSSQ